MLAQSSTDRLIRDLSPNELDNLKFSISAAAKSLLLNRFQMPTLENQKSFNRLLEKLIQIQPYRDRIPEFGICFQGRPKFLTKDLLTELQREAIQNESKAVANFQQMIFQPNTPGNSTAAEGLGACQSMKELVESVVGPVAYSEIPSYIYYNRPGLLSNPHVDNRFTSITVMIGLEHSCNQKKYSSRSVVYWPGKDPYFYQLHPGEMTIFFGCSVLHGRTPVQNGERVTSLLLSYRAI